MCFGFEDIFKRNMRPELMVEEKESDRERGGGDIERHREGEEGSVWAKGVSVH